MTEAASVRRATVAIGAGHPESLTQVDSIRSAASAGPDMRWVDSILKVLDRAGAVVGVVAVEVDPGEILMRHCRALAEDLDALRSERPSVKFAFVANVLDADDQLMTELIDNYGFDVVLFNATPAALRTNIRGLLRFISATAHSEATPATVPNNAYLRIGAWTIELASKRAILPDGSKANLSEVEIDFIRRLVAKDEVSAVSAFMLGEIREWSMRPSAVVHKIRRKLGKDFPIVSLGGDEYRIDGALR